jgi:hypothetical protein
MLDHVRCLSHRQLSMRLLPRLQQEGTVGESFICTTEAEVQELLTQYGHLLLKAPWSSSGRGLRYLSADRNPFSQHAGWFRNTVEAQGGVMVEPYYNKVKDFGMEFEAQADGSVAYVGLSLFHTVNGAYVGNLLAPEEEKWQTLAQHIDPAALHQVRKVVEKVVGEWCRNCYDGPFGVDMMVVRQQQGFALHPCVEVNLRRTMGHVALDVAKKTQDQYRVMRVAYENGTYRLRLE